MAGLPVGGSALENTEGLTLGVSAHEDTEVLPVGGSAPHKNMVGLPAGGSIHEDSEGLHVGGSAHEYSEGIPEGGSAYKEMERPMGPTWAAYIRDMGLIGRFPLPSPTPPSRWCALGGGGYSYVLSIATRGRLSFVLGLETLIVVRFEELQLCLL